MKYKDVFLAIFSGILLITIFPSLNLSFLSWVALVPLLWSIRNKSLKQAFFLGFLAGLVAFAGILYWLVPMLAEYGNIPIPLSLLVVVILAAYLGLYVAFFALLVRLWSVKFPASRITFLYGAAVWVALELLRTYVFTGFPWALLGYSQWQSVRLIQVAEFTGVYGVSFLIVMVNVALSQLIGMPTLRKKKKISRLESLIIPALMLEVCLLYGFLVIPASTGFMEQPSVRVAVVQANIKQDMKWDQSRQFEILDKYALLTRAASREGAAVIVWPETAVPGYMRYQTGLLFRVKNVARSNKIWLVTGSPDYSDEKYYNSAFLIAPDGEIAGQYNKMHLVLFGEKIPWRKPLSVFFKIFDELGDYTPGDKVVLMETPLARIGTEICFESVFPDLFRRFVKNGADIMVNLTEDSWYGRTSAPGQHFSVNIFRAVENRVALVRAANTGISGFIDPYGRTGQISSIFNEDFLTEDVPLRNKTTFYTHYGDLFSYLCAVVTVVSILVLVLKRGKT
jgi:apolipoprotein N-acyltransferase